MGNFDDCKPNSKEHDLRYALESLEEAMFRFCVFVDSFNRYLKKAGLLKDIDKLDLID